MSIVITFDVQAKEGKKNDLLALFTETLADTRAFEGCIRVDLHTEAEIQNTVFMIEEWASKSAYEKYLAWRGERGDMEKLMSLAAAEPTIRFFERV
ncbi:MAG: hypothetical protein GKR93_00390 [Gammaproteobacteria bacterium]|nr:hypothetical protein [Gammaproteobacteria bacterium]